MKSILSLWICSFILASCVAPQPQPRSDTEPYEEQGVARVIKKDSRGNEKESWAPDQGIIVVDGDKIQFLDDESGEMVTVEPSYSVEYER